MYQYKIIKILSFNTLYVIGSKNINPIIKAEFRRFQYIICNRFKVQKVKMEKILLCFNTLYVIGSTIVSSKLLEKTLFQYIICNRFKKKKSSS